MRKPIYIKLFTYTLIIAEKNINNIAFAENGFVLQKKENKKEYTAPTYQIDLGTHKLLY